MRLTAIQAARPPQKNPSAVERGRDGDCVEDMLWTECIVYTAEWHATRLMYMAGSELDWLARV